MSISDGMWWRKESERENIVNGPTSHRHRKSPEASAEALPDRDAMMMCREDGCSGSAISPHHHHLPLLRRTAP